LRMDVTGARLVLPPFPTRRSSDLIVDGHRIQTPHGSGVMAGHAVARTVSQGRLHLPAQRAGERAARMEAAARRDVAGAGQVAREDRKSTRLNSSHVKISYAVFCLK